MEYISELHTHSRFAGACSDKLTLENIDATCYLKGIGIIGSADFTHPTWFKEMKDKLVSQGNGLFRVKGSKTNVNFIVSGEVCTIVSKNGGENAGMFDKSGSVEKIHHGILAPDLETIEQVNVELAKHGDLALDGRPQLKMSSSDFVETLMKINKKIFIYPAHAWTPWFGVFGSFSGYNSIEEAYQDQAKNIYALETGLSSDPAMNWRLSQLDKFAIISGGDAHSLPKLGREATVFDIDEKKLSYDAVIDAIKSKKMKYTIEFYPEEGKYHYDGHRNCNCSLSPEEAKRFNGMCPVCGKRLTLGVLHRIEELADRPEGFVPKNSVPFVHCVPLIEVLAYVTKKGAYTKTVQDLYNKLLKSFGTEFNVTIKSDIESIRAVDKELASAILNIREEKVNIIPGYDRCFRSCRHNEHDEEREGGQANLIKSKWLKILINNVYP